MKKKCLIILFSIILLLVVKFSNVSFGFITNITIDEILETKNYSYLSPKVKEFIKYHYEKTGEIFYTEKNAKTGEAYLNPSYIEYLDSTDKSGYNVIPPVTTYTINIKKIDNSNNRSVAKAGETLPESFDLRSYNGKNFVTPNKNQGSEGLCWAYSTVSLLETHDLIAKNKSYNSGEGVSLSEKQIDYALSSDGIIGGNKVVTDPYRIRELSSGGTLNDPEVLLIERLGGYQDSWNSVNNVTWNSGTSSYSNNPLEPYNVFDRTQAIYEVNDSVDLVNINQNPLNVAYNESVKNIIKDLVYHNGGATVNVRASDYNLVRNVDATEANNYLFITNTEYYTAPSEQHAMHLIGWDDNYEYSFCAGDAGGTNGKFVSDNGYYNSNHECGNASYMGNIYSTTKVTGTGAWILKNSWGSSYSYIYLPYDSFINEMYFITGYATTQNWDNSNTADVRHYYNSGTGAWLRRYSVNNPTIEGDLITEIKVRTDSAATIELYYSADGNQNNLSYIDEYTFDYAGIHTINLENKNLHISDKAYFQTEDYYEVVVFTRHVGTTPKGYTEDFEYTIDDDYPTNEKYLTISVATKLNNIPDNSTITYKLKKSERSIFPDTAYTISLNKSYYDMVTPIIKIQEEYAKKGNYTLEAYYGDHLLYSSAVHLDLDYLSINGSGTSSDPWRITTTRHFNMMRNAQEDNFVLMNDLDFEYDTQDENGIFYNNGEGFKAINFKGNLNGNNKTISGIKTSSGIFGTFTASGSCPYSKCGVHDLKVVSLVRDNCEQATGGIINILNVYDTYTYNFSNLALSKATFTANKKNFDSAQHNYLYVGGIIGSLQVYANSSSGSNTILKFDNWFSNYDYNVIENINVTRGYIGGLVGIVDSYNGAYISINNSKVNSAYHINRGTTIDYYASDLVGGTLNHNAYFNINSAIGSVTEDYTSGINVASNAFIGKMETSGNEGTFVVNGVKSSLNYTPISFVTVKEYELNLKPYELARADYSNLVYYQTMYYASDTQQTGYSTVNFSSKFNVYGNKIPTLKTFNENYSDYYTTYNMFEGQTKPITELIKTDTNNRKFNVYKSFNCNLDVCNNVTNEDVVKIISVGNNYQIQGVGVGQTTLIIYDELSGYLDKVTVTVSEGSNNVHSLILDYNYDNIVDSTQVITEGSAYGNMLPTLTREHYTFLGWFTERDGGTEVTANTIFNGTEDITLYAHWEKETHQCVITFIHNDGLNTTSTLILKDGVAITFPQVTRTGYRLINWTYNDVPVDGTTSFADLDTATIVANWSPITYTIIFNANGGKGSMANLSMTYGEYKDLTRNTYTREGYTFKGWSTTSTGAVVYNDGARVGNLRDTQGTSFILYAVWQQDGVVSLKTLLQNSGYTVKGNYIYGFAVGKEIAQIRNQFSVNGVTVISSTTLISTGTVLKLGNESYTVVIKGDLNGDGKINSADLLQMRKHLLEEISLNGAYEQAGIIESTNTIKSLDLLRLRQYLLGEYTIK